MATEVPKYSKNTTHQSAPQEAKPTFLIRNMTIDHYYQTLKESDVIVISDIITPPK